MLNLKPLQLPEPRITFKAPREWLPRLRALIEAHPQDDLASTEALCCRIVGDFTAGIVLHRLLYWLPKSIRHDSTIWKSDREWYAELNLSYAQMQRVRARLAPIVKSWVERAQGAPTYHYQLRVDGLLRGIATVLNCSSVDVKLALLERVENRFSAESKNDSRQSRKSITIQHQQDERLGIYQSYLSRFVGLTPDLSTRLADQYTRLGESNVREVLERCNTSRGKSWKYVLQALENVSAPAISLLDPASASSTRHEEEGTRDKGFIIGDLQQTWERLKANRPEPAPTDSHAEDWKRILAQCEIQFGSATFNMWLSAVRYLKYEGGAYHISVPSNHVRDMLQHRMYHSIQSLVMDTTGQSSEICFEVQTPMEVKNG